MDWERRMRQAWAAVVALGVALSWVSARGAGGVDEAFPLAGGTYWLYRGVVRLGGEDDKVTETSVSWRMEVTTVIRREGLVAAVVRGFPSELNWSDGEKKPGESLVIASADGKFYQIEGEGTAAGLRRLQDPNDKLRDLLTVGSLFLDLPLREGKKFGEEEGVSRDDGMYCWAVISEAPASLKNVKGVGAAKRTAFTVRYATNPDDQEFDFVPGIGITAYGYHHHGTVADTELQLVEFHAGGNDEVAGSGEAGFGFGQRGVNVEERLDAGDIEDVADAVVEADEGEFAAGFVAGNEGANESADGEGIDGGDFGEVDDELGGCGGGEGVVEGFGGFGGDGAFYGEDGEAFGVAGVRFDAKGCGVHRGIVMGRRGQSRELRVYGGLAAGTGLPTRAR